MTAFDRVAPTYDSTPNPLLGLEERILAPLIPDLNGLTVADVGAGTGRWLRRVQAENAIAIDTSIAMLARAPHQRVIADARGLPFRDASIDVVLCTFTIGYVPS